jgi:hypothetical protein
MTSSTSSTSPNNQVFFIMIDRAADDDGDHDNNLEAEVVAEVQVLDGRLHVLNTDQPLSPDLAPLARVIRRKLAPKSGNHLFVS